MLSYETTKTESDEVFKALTSLSQVEFEKLLGFFKAALDDYVEKNYQVGKERKRKSGGGRKPTLRTYEDKLLFILFYLKNYSLQEVLGFLFGMDQSQANRWIDRLSQVLKLALSQGGYLPERKGQILEDVLAENQLKEFIIDGTERRKQRPKDPEKQKKYYSGKKNALG